MLPLFGYAQTSFTATLESVSATTATLVTPRAAQQGEWYGVDCISSAGTLKSGGIFTVHTSVMVGDLTPATQYLCRIYLYPTSSGGQVMGMSNEVSFITKASSTTDFIATLESVSATTATLMTPRAAQQGEWYSASCSPFTGKEDAGIYTVHTSIAVNNLTPDTQYTCRMYIFPTPEGGQTKGKSIEVVFTTPSMDPQSADELAMPTFNVELRSNPKAPPSSPHNWTAPVVKIRVGDSIEFTRTRYQTTASFTGTWSYDDTLLSCTESVDVLTCKAIAEGDVRVFTTITDYNTDGTAASVESNFISVTVDNTPQTSLEGKLLPDLRISANKIQLVSRRVKGVVKKMYKIHVLVSNKGKGKAAGTIRYAVFRAGSMEDKMVTTQGLAAGKSKKMFYYVDAAEKGSTIAFSVDATNTIEEIDETNNEVQVTVEKK